MQVLMKKKIKKREKIYPAIKKVNTETRRKGNEIGPINGKPREKNKKKGIDSLPGGGFWGRKVQLLLDSKVRDRVILSDGGGERIG